MVAKKSSKTTAAKKTTTPISIGPFATREPIPILRGDVFGAGSTDRWDVVVVGVGALKCECRRAFDGRHSSVQTSRLLSEYNRRGTIDTKRAQKSLAKIIEREAKGGK